MKQRRLDGTRAKEPGPLSPLLRSSGEHEAREAVEFLKRRWQAQPRVAIVLGSGLAGAVVGFREAKRIPYKSIPHFGQPTVPGHSGTLHMGFWAGVPVAVLEGRLHLYEGYTANEAVFPIRVLGLAGADVFVLTCAAGGIASQARPGSFMAFSDHLNLQGQNPLVGMPGVISGTRFIDMTTAYDKGLRRIALAAARALRIKCFEGVYAAVLGPSFETPAEIRALKRLGADAVGMSTVPEVIAARQMGWRVLAIAAITNRAAGLARRGLTHEEVLTLGTSCAPSLGRFLERVLHHLA